MNTKSQVLTLQRLSCSPPLRVRLAQTMAMLSDGIHHSPFPPILTGFRSCLKPYPNRGSQQPESSATITFSISWCRSGVQKGNPRRSGDHLIAGHHVHPSSCRALCASNVPMAICSATKGALTLLTRSPASPLPCGCVHAPPTTQAHPWEWRPLQGRDP